MIVHMIFWAVIPAILIVVYTFKRDLFPEPPRIVFITFLLGFLSIFPISLGNIFLDDYGNSLNTSYFGLEFYTNFLRAGFHEELYKFLILYYFCSRHSEFNEPMDAIVYGVAASLGFSAFENIGYVLNHESFYTSWQHVAQVRVLPTIMHGTNGVLMGLLLSKVLFINRNHTRLILALLIPTLFHGVYNQMVTFYSGLTVILLLFAIIYIVSLAKKIRKQQELKIIETEVKETISNSIVFQTILFSLISIIILIAIVINII